MSSLRVRPGGSGASAGGAAVLFAGGAAVLFAGGAVAAFGDAIFANGFGVLPTPGVRAERRVVGFAGEQAIEDVLEVGPDVQVIADRTAHQREEVRGAFARRYTAHEQPIFAAKRHLLH